MDGGNDAWFHSRGILRIAVGPEAHRLVDLKPVSPPSYTYEVIWSEEDNEFVGLCAEFPSLSWLEPAQEAAFYGIRSPRIGRWRNAPGKFF